MGIIEAIAAALIKFLAGWISGRQSAKAAKQADDNRAGAVVDSATIRNQTDKEIQDANNQTAQSLDSLSTHAGSVRDETSDVQAAIDSANRDMR